MLVFLEVQKELKTTMAANGPQQIFQNTFSSSAYNFHCTSSCNISRLSLLISIICFRFYILRLFSFSPSQIKVFSVAVQLEEKCLLIVDTTSCRLCRPDVSHLQFWLEGTDRWTSVFTRTSLVYLQLTLKSVSSQWSLGLTESFCWPNRQTKKLHKTISRPKITKPEQKCF